MPSIPPRQTSASKTTKVRRTTEISCVATVPVLSPSISASASDKVTNSTKPAQQNEEDCVVINPIEGATMDDVVITDLPQNVSV